MSLTNLLGIGVTIIIVMIVCLGFIVISLFGETNDKLDRLLKEKGPGPRTKDSTPPAKHLELK